jgi:hypothetical protein
MQKRKTVEELAGAAAQLCAAHDELRAAGYEGWSREIRALIDIIDAEIEWLRGDHLTIRLATSE